MRVRIAHKIIFLFLITALFSQEKFKPLDWTSEEVSEYIDFYHVKSVANPDSLDENKIITPYQAKKRNEFYKHLENHPSIYDNFVILLDNELIEGVLELVESVITARSEITVDLESINYYLEGLDALQYYLDNPSFQEQVAMTPMKESKKEALDFLQGTYWESRLKLIDSLNPIILNELNPTGKEITYKNQDEKIEGIDSLILIYKDTFRKLDEYNQLIIEGYDDAIPKHQYMEEIARVLYAYYWYIGNTNQSTKDIDKSRFWRNEYLRVNDEIYRMNPDDIKHIDILYNLLTGKWASRSINFLNFSEGVLDFRKEEFAFGFSPSPMVERMDFAIEKIIKEMSSEAHESFRKEYKKEDHIISSIQEMKNEDPDLYESMVERFMQDNLLFQMFAQAFPNIPPVDVFEMYSNMKFLPYRTEYPIPEDFDEFMTTLYVSLIKTLSSASLRAFNFGEKEESIIYYEKFISYYDSINKESLKRMIDKSFLNENQFFITEILSSKLDGNTVERNLLASSQNSWVDSYSGTFITDETFNQISDKQADLNGKNKVLFTLGERQRTFDMSEITNIDDMYKKALPSLGVSRDEILEAMGETSIAPITFLLYKNEPYTRKERKMLNDYFLESKKFYKPEDNNYLFLYMRHLIYIDKVDEEEVFKLMHDMAHVINQNVTIGLIQQNPIKYTPMIELQGYLIASTPLMIYTKERESVTHHIYRMFSDSYQSDLYKRDITVTMNQIDKIRTILDDNINPDQLFNDYMSYDKSINVDNTILQKIRRLLEKDTTVVMYRINSEQFHTSNFIEYYGFKNDGTDEFDSTEEYLWHSYAFNSVDNTYFFDQSELSALDSIETLGGYDTNILQKTISLENQVSLVRNNLNNNIDTSKDLKEFSKILIEPIEGYIEGSKRLIIIPDPYIQDIPFEILQDSQGNYLYEKYDISYANSLKEYYSNIVDKKNISDQISFTMFGDIDYSDYKNLDKLVWSKDEISDIKKIFPNAKVYKGKEATETAFKNINFKDSDFIHLSTHGIFYEEDYRKSSIILGKDNSNDGKLTYLDVDELNLDVDTIILSACSTNKGKIIKNMNTMSLQKSFKNVGARNVISTIWDIDEKASYLFMVLFYNELKTTRDTTKALSLTKRKFIKKYPEYSNPHYWAAFVNYGY